MGYKSLNNAFTTLAATLSNVATSMTVNTGQGDRFPVIAGADYTYVTLEDVAGNIEIVKVTARATTSDVFTIERAQDGTTARNWASGDIVELRMIALLMETALAHVDDAAGAHAASAISFTPTGAVSSSTVQAAIAELDADITTLSNAITTTNGNVTTVSNALTAHLVDTSDAHDASAISYAGGTGMSATDVEAAIDELANEKANVAGQTFTGAVAVPDAAYDATTWNGSSEVPTKNAIRDKFESLVTTSIVQNNTSVSVSDAGTDGKITHTVDGVIIGEETDVSRRSTIDGGSTLYPEFRCRAWANFNGSSAGTFAGGASTVTRIAASTTATITTTDPHGLTTGNKVQALSGVAAGDYVVTVTGANTFTITTVATTALSAVAITFAFVLIKGAGNVNSVADIGTGTYFINFTTAMPDANYAPACTALWGVERIGVNVVLDNAAGFEIRTATASVGADSSVVGIVVMR
jgi:hypothetical protein